MQNFFIKNNTIKGFTLIETLVALAIFSSAIVGMIVILAGGIANTTFVKNKTSATYLSQEGVELVRNLRDSYSLTGSGGWAGFAANMTTNCSTACQMVSDATGVTVVTPCQNSGFGAYLCQSLNYNISTGFYNYLNNQGSTASPFTRVVIVSPVGGGTDEFKVRSIVTWDDHGNTLTTESNENLFNWQ